MRLRLVGPVVLGDSAADMCCLKLLATVTRLSSLTQEALRHAFRALEFEFKELCCHETCWHCAVLSKHQGCNRLDAFFGSRCSQVLFLSLVIAVEHPYP